MTVQRIQDIEAEELTRIPTTYDELDWFYGRSGSWGQPCSRIILWGGESGTGKTRLLVSLAKRWDAIGISTMFAQGEVTPAQFKGDYLKGFTPEGGMWVMSGMTVPEIKDAIQKYRPKVFITDSVQQIEEYAGGRGAKEVVRELREACEPGDTSIILISQLTTGGTAKGGTELPHEVDGVCYLRKMTKPQLTPAAYERLQAEVLVETERRHALGIMDTPAKVFEDLIVEMAADMGTQFTMEMDKCRFAPAGRSTVWQHEDWGVDCISNNRFDDKKWVDEHPGSSVPMMASVSPVVSPPKEGLLSKFWRKGLVGMFQGD